MRGSTLAPLAIVVPQTYRRIVKQAAFADAGHGYDVFGLHPPSLAGAIAAARPFYERYFRVDSAGIHHIPATGPAIVIANHAGLLPVDAAMLGLDILLRSDPPRIPRPVSDHFIPRLPLVSTLFARLGVVSGTRPNVRCLLERGELVAIWPEGVSGPAKSFRERYRIQSWRVGFAELAIRYHAPVIPVAIVGAEESWPLLARLAMHPFGAPYVPIPATVVPLPTHYHIRYGAPLWFEGDADDPGVVGSAAVDARLAVVQLLEQALAERTGVFL